VSHKTIEHSTFSPSVIKLRWKMQPLSLRILKHYKQKPPHVATFW